MDDTELAYSLRLLGWMMKAKRGKRGLRDAAAEVGISLATFNRIERGLDMPSLRTFAKLCRWLDVDPGMVLETRD